MSQRRSHPRHVPLELAVVLAFDAAPVFASGSRMPWEQPLQQILNSVQGPVSKIVAVLIIIMTGFTLAFGETGGGFRRLSQIVLGISIAFAGIVLLHLIFQFQRGSSGVMMALAKQDTWLVPNGCGVIRYNDGRLQRTARFSGPPLETAPPAELVAMWARINDTLRDLGPRWLFFVHTNRSAVRRTPVVSLLSSGAQLVQTEDDCVRDKGRSHHENVYFLSFVLHSTKPNGWGGAAGELEDQARAESAGRNAVVDGFIHRTDAALRTIEGLACETCWLCEEEAISYSRACMTSEGQGIRRWFRIALGLMLFASYGSGGLVS
jgi:type IV secretion system protein TrbC